MNSELLREPDDLADDELSILFERRGEDDSQSVLTLEQRLAKFDPERHGGEMMQLITYNFSCPLNHNLVKKGGLVCHTKRFVFNSLKFFFLCLR